MKRLFIKLVGVYINGLSYFSRSYATKNAMYLFGTPRKGKISRVQSDFLDTAFREELKYKQDYMMTYRWLGTDKTILLAHGWESNSARWQSLILKLKRHKYNIIALDAPAHGKSGSKLFNAILYSEFIHVAAKRFKPDIVIGHSVGGMAAVFSQHKYQMPFIKKLILLGVPSEFTGVLQRYNDMLGYNQRISKGITATVIDRFGEPPSAFSTAKRLENITSKGLIIHDEEDDIIPYADAIQIKNSFKNSELISTKGLGHSLNNETVSSHIEAFIEA